MKKDAVIVLDCGATNIRAIAVDRGGNILASKSFPNQTKPDPCFEGGLIWDTEYILSRLSEASKHVCAAIGHKDISGVCSTSFGVDGAPYDKDGKQLYPVISWACDRTRTIMDEVHNILPSENLYRISGLNEFHFNTLYKLFWLKKFRSDIVEKMHHWLFMPSIISGLLCGKPFTDVSMLGTSMLCERESRSLSKEILNAFDIDKDIFPSLVEAGEKIGEVTAEASEKTGIPKGVPVFAAGHDTQFAIMGSGAGVNEPVLSSGTWEVLMVRTPDVSVGQDTFKNGITTELDAVPGLYNAGIQWLGSRHIEELKHEYFQDVLHKHDVYDIMIEEAEHTKSHRGILFRNLLEELSNKTRSGLQFLESSCGFKSESLIVVGGGSKNTLWNKIRSETLGIEIKPNPQAETTVLGAARMVFENLQV